MTFLKKYYPLFLILILASALRIHLLLTRGTFWFDEIFSVHFSSLPWKDALRYWLMETNPPFYTFFLRFWLKIAPVSNELLVRLPSLIIGLASIALLYYFAQKFFSKRAAIAASLFFALSDINIYLSIEARGYGFLVLFAILSFFIYFEIFFNNKKTWGWWLAYFLTNGLLLSTHLTALTVPFGQALCLILLKPNKTDLKKWWLGHIIIGLIWLCWFVPSIIAKIDPASLTAWYFNSDTNANNDNIAILLISLFFTSFHRPRIVAFAIIIFTLLVYQFARDFKNIAFEEKKRRVVIAVWAFLLPVAGAMVGVLTPKFYAASAPALYLIIGEGLSIASAKRAKYFLVFLLAAGLFLLPSALLTSSKATFSWHTFTNFIEQRETEKSVIIITPFNEELALKYYYRGKSPIIGIYMRDDNMPLDERVVRYNWNRQTTSKKNLAEWMEKKIAGANRVFYIQYTCEYDWTPEILKQKKWKLYATLKPSDFLSVCLFEFRAPDEN